jgi:glycosyltransferase involved in cell wall biosynthesis
MSNIECSVIIPSYRSAATIGACLRALLAQRDAPAYEIIVVDSSPDETAAIVRRDFPQVRLIERAQQTDPATGRNLGAAEAKGAIFCFIDSDCVAAPDWLARLAARVNEGYSAVGGAIANANGETLASWAGYICEFREFLPGGPARPAANLTIGNSAYRASDFLALGGFPAGYFPQEDQVFHKAMRAKGLRIMLDPAIIVAHSHRSQPAEYLAHQRKIGQANARVLQTVDLPGAWLARNRALAALALPALVPYRLARTLYACRGVAGGLALRSPALLWLCLRGMIAWGHGFFEAST